ncbi:MAG: hypothetical protein HKP30_03435 [Myxococcales bacterium]|nr:hypothetical protein [Myxococcales bacterium]
MFSRTAGQSLGRFRKTAWLLCLLSLGIVSGKCVGGAPPTVSLTLNNVSDDLKSLMVVPTSGFVINATFTSGADPIDPASITLLHQRWGGGPQQELDVLTADANGAVGVLPAALALEEGTHTFAVTVQDTQGRLAAAVLDFAVREIEDPAPIAVNQFFFFDFSVDRDGDTEPDFPNDLQLFGLGSPVDPVASASIETAVREATLGRIREAYWSQPTSGLASDPIAVGIFDFDPGAPTIWDTTRICVGGEDPSGGITIGNILIDPNNGNRTSVECGSLPPTGIFPAELLYYGGEAAFQTVFDPLMTSRGGTPVGEHALDAIVLDPGFDYESGSAAEQARHDDVFAAVTAFGDALGSIAAHEAGHALGLVPPAAPGVGLHGGQAGAAFSHAVQSNGSTPADTHMMNAGNSFSFAELAGLEGEPLPAFRPLSYAYLRDRTLTDSKITQLLMPPSLTSVVPDVIDASTVQVTLTGADFVGVPAIQLVSESWVYSTPGESIVDPNTVTFWVVQSQLLPGLYDLVYTAADGQVATLVDAITVE